MSAGHLLRFGFSSTIGQFTSSQNFLSCIRLIHPISFDATYLYEYTFILLYNLVFTSLPVIALGGRILSICIGDPDTSLPIDSI